MLWRDGKRRAVDFKNILMHLEKISSLDNHKIIIGTDSVKVEDYWVFTKAIAIFSDDKDLDRKYFYLRQIINEDFRDLSKRLLKETTDSIELAINVRERLSNANIEIHADVSKNEINKSNKYHSSITGYISGCGFDVKTKPDSFVASSIADNHTRKKWSFLKPSYNDYRYKGDYHV